MQAAPARYVSVSELYATDEVELLLDEIRELEPTSCRGEDLQDFEIAGSGCGAGAGGRSPAGTEATERSWDSHAQYRRSGPRGVPSALAPLYCRPAALRGARPLAALALLLLSGAACACAWAAGGWRLAHLAPAQRPGARFLLLGALSTALLQLVLLGARVSRLHELLALRWSRAAAATAGWALLALAVGGARTLASPGPQPAPLQAAAGLSLCASLVAAFSLLWGLRDCVRSHAAAKDSSVSTRAAYRAVPTAPPPLPSTSRDPPL